MTVPTTPTATDKLEEVRKLNLEIAGLTRARDLAKDVAEGAQSAADEATKRAKAAEEHLKALEASMAGSAAEIREFVAYCRNILQTSITAMEELTQWAKDLQKKVDDLSAQITASQKTLEDLRTTLSKENEGMSVKRDDLEIYEERIRTAAQEVGIKITL